MFDMSWGEVMLIGGVALVVIGPKDLPRALRTVGQVTGKLKRMAGEFQAQFNEAMREAELDEVKREVEGVNRSVSTFNPVQTIRNELKGAVDSAGAKPSSETLAAATAQLHEEAAKSEAPGAESSADPLGDPAQPSLPGIGPGPEIAEETHPALEPSPATHPVAMPEVPAVPEPASGLEVAAPPKPAEAPPVPAEAKS